MPTWVRAKGSFNHLQPRGSVSWCRGQQPVGLVYPLGTRCPSSSLDLHHEAPQRVWIFTVAWRKEVTSTGVSLEAAGQLEPPSPRAQQSGGTLWPAGVPLSPCLAARRNPVASWSPLLPVLSGQEEPCGQQASAEDAQWAWKSRRAAPHLAVAARDEASRHRRCQVSSRRCEPAPEMYRFQVKIMYPTKNN